MSIEHAQEKRLARYKVEGEASPDGFEEGFRRGYQTACLFVSEDIDPRHPIVEDEVLSRPRGTPKALLSLALFAIDMYEPEAPAYGRVCADAEEILALSRALIAQWLDRHQDQGRAEGLAVGRAHGRARGLRLGIKTACDLLHLKFTARQRALLYMLDATALEELLSYLRRERRWPRMSAIDMLKQQHSGDLRLAFHEGFTRGHVDSFRLAIRAIYESRLGLFPPALSAILDATTDVACLEAWLDRTATCSAEDFAAFVLGSLMNPQINYENWLDQQRTEAMDLGRAQGFRKAIEVACHLLGLEINTGHRAQLEALDVAAMEEVLSHLQRERRWP